MDTPPRMNRSVVFYAVTAIAIFGIVLCLVAVAVVVTFLTRIGKDKKELAKRKKRLGTASNTDTRSMYTDTQSNYAGTARSNNIFMFDENYVDSDSAHFQSKDNKDTYLSITSKPAKIYQDRTEEYVYNTNSDEQ